ncbi:TetR/AcrR family transcriptional regulator [Ferrimonas aestuarii]|uniref:TetR/AcrR family transcriptional regulator n=1 Tax=Ferrimonas aestuarii TaxID=2569539 RepID=A0A4U1BHR4_9GAMM|nr:TetR/AcrR family transcriptional regulator [Ferrimonas aestuarii]TKB50960.1 TetR/AcrR family transcriptional regulator [Ferrimonas aestuarii]
MGKHRQRIFEAARVLVAEKGVFALSMRDLAKTADISIGTLYREIRNKDDLVLLMAADNVRRHGEGLEQAAEFGLNPAEQMMFCIGFAPYCIDFANLNSDKALGVGADFLIGNCDLVSQATESAIDEFQASFNQYRKLVDDLVIRLSQRGAFSDSYSRAKEVAMDLSILCRGTRVMRIMRTNLKFRANQVDTQKLCQLAELILGQLEWQQSSPLLDAKKLELAWRTVMDHQRAVSR